MSELLIHPVGSKLPLSGSASAAMRAMAVQSKSTLRYSDVATDRQGQSKEETAMQAAEQLVASVLVQPVLDQMIEDPFRSEMFHGGEGEKMFQRQANHLMAQRVVQGAHFPVVQSVYQKLLKSNTPANPLNRLA